jgi:hypothetical protein
VTYAILNYVYDFMFESYHKDKNIFDVCPFTGSELYWPQIIYYVLSCVHV